MRDRWADGWILRGRKLTMQLRQVGSGLTLLLVFPVVNGFAAELRGTPFLASTRSQPRPSFPPFYKSRLS